jgi:hypothetical protein
MTSLDDLVREGRIERVDADSSAARDKMAEAERHLASAAAIASTDREGAYSLLYDAARKALTAHMTAKGFRVKKGEGAHVAVGRYATAALGSEESIEAFEYMRRLRNRTEYSTWHVGADRLRRDLRHAEAITSIVREDLES